MTHCWSVLGGLSLKLRVDQPDGMGDSAGLVVGGASYRGASSYGVLRGVYYGGGASISATGKTLTWSVVHGTAREGGILGPGVGFHVYSPQTAHADVCIECGG